MFTEVSASLPVAAEDPAGHRATDPVGERHLNQRVVPSTAGHRQHPREDKTLSPACKASASVLTKQNRLDLLKKTVQIS